MANGFPVPRQHDHDHSCRKHDEQHAAIRYGQYWVSHSMGGRVYRGRHVRATGCGRLPVAGRCEDAPMLWRLALGHRGVPSWTSRVRPLMRSRPGTARDPDNRNHASPGPGAGLGDGTPPTLGPKTAADVPSTSRCVELDDQRQRRGPDSSDLRGDGCDRHRHRCTAATIWWCRSTARRRPYLIRPLFLSSSCNRSCAASSTSLCRHSAAR